MGRLRWLVVVALVSCGGGAVDGGAQDTGAADGLAGDVGGIGGDAAGDVAPDVAVTDTGGGGRKPDATGGGPDAAHEDAVDVADTAAPADTGADAAPTDATNDAVADVADAGPDALADAADATPDAVEVPDGSAEDTADATDATDAPEPEDAADAVADTADTTPEDALTDAAWEDAADSADAADADPADTADAAPEDAGPPFEYAWQPGGPCDAPPYEWLPPSEVGKLLSYESMPLYSQSPETIKLLLAQLGYPGDELPITHGTLAWRIRYLTQDRGQLVEATAMVGVPNHGSSPDPVSVDAVLFMHPTVGYADQCAPSDGLYGGAAAVLPASFGYISVAPDLIGMCGAANPCGGFHPYLIGEPTAIAALDAVRAAEELLALVAADTHVQPTHRVVPWGGSQGGHAALFVDRYAPVYAPEVDIGCVIAIVPPSDLAGQAAAALAVLDSSTALGTAFLAAAVLWYTPAGGAAAVFNAAGSVDFAAQVVGTFPTTCSTGDLVKGAQSAEDLFAAGFLEAISSGDLGALPPWGCIAAENSLPTTSVPLLSDSEILFVLGSADEIVDHATEIASFETLCTQGYRLELVDCAGASHGDTAVDSLPLQIAWIQSCLAGEGIPEELTCVVTPPSSCK